LTLNPCIDRALYLGKPLVTGDIHRVARVVENAAGKGLNQAVVFENLGTTPDYYSFSAQGEDAMSRFISTRALRNHATVAACGIRTNIKVIDSDGVGTELNEAGGPITQDELEALLSELDRFEGDIVSVCGSIPQGVEKDIYANILARAKAKGHITVLDADGEALKKGLEGRPDYIKPNRRELAGLFDMTERELDSDEKVISLARRVLETYGTAVLCTLDADGSLYVGSDGIYRVGVAKVPLRGFAGAGDTYLAAFLHAKYAENKPIPDALAFAARASAAKIALGGSELPTREQINAVEQVKVQNLS
jgi:1-phosphofructokinase